MTNEKRLMGSMRGVHDEKGPVLTEITVRVPGGKERTFTAQELAELAGFFRAATVELSISRGGIRIFAQAEPAERDYPGITVDASAEPGRTLYLGNFEMPCETYPHRIAGRLYAGDSRYETDGPIALVTHDVMLAPKTDMYAGKYGGQPRPMRKLVYVDNDLAESRSWTESDEDRLPEHREDE